MKDPQRYMLMATDVYAAEPGEYVKYDDYIKLKEKYIHLVGVINKWRDVQTKEWHELEDALLDFEKQEKQG